MLVKIHVIQLHCMFPIQGVQYSYSQVYGRIIGYQFGDQEAFVFSGGTDDMLIE